MSGGRHRGSRTVGALVAGLLMFAAYQVSAGIFGWGFARIGDSISDGITDDLKVHLFTEPAPIRAMSIVVPREAEVVFGYHGENSGVAATAWAESIGGGAADGVSFDLELFGTVDHPVIITGIDAESVCHSGRGDVWHVLPPGAGPFQAKPVRIDLDRVPAAGVPEPEQLFDGAEQPWTFPLQVSKSEAERLTVLAESRRDCEFVLWVRFSSAGENERLKVDHRGQPFRVLTSTQAERSLYWNISGTSATIVPSL